MDRIGSGLLGSRSSGDSNMGVPVTSSPNSVLSPYMNFDPALILSDPDSQFIMPEGASQRRGRFELAFSQIGSSVCIGGALGGVHGIYSGLKETRASQLTGPVRRTQMLNFITKKGASSAQSLGVVALMYSIFGVIISKARGAEDELNTLSAATATGLLYKSSAGMKRCLRGGAVGFGLAAAYCLVLRRDHMKRMIGMRD